MNLSVEDLPEKNLSQKDLSEEDPSEADSSEECVYLCGCSLGLKPRSADRVVQEQLDKWANMYVTCMVTIISKIDVTNNSNNI